MACGNTEVSRDGLVAQPSAPAHPRAHAQAAAREQQAQRVENANRELRSATIQLERASTKSTVERTVGKAKAALDSARRGNAPRSEVQKLERNFEKLRQSAREKADRIAHDEAISAARASGSGNPVQAAFLVHRAQASDPPAPVDMPSTGTKASIDLVSKWSSAYERRTGNELFEIDLGACTYSFDTNAGRLVCVRGHSAPPESARDGSRQKGHPRAPRGDHKGHVIAHSMGGGMDMNIVNQAASVNLGKRWRGIETLAAENPGTAVAVHLMYDDDSSDRPTGFEYGYDDPSSGFQVECFENPES